MSEPDEYRQCCAHLHVGYDPIKNEDGSMIERWLCKAKCGTEFVMAARLNELMEVAQRVRDGASDRNFRNSRWDNHKHRIITLRESLFQRFKRALRKP